MQRIYNFDLVRGFMVLLLPSVHVLMVYGNREVQQSLPGYLLVFIGECTGAQLSMLMMGILFSFSKGPRLRRGLHLILIGYALNFFRFLLPLALNLIPGKFLYDCGQYEKSSAISLNLFAGNIFHFAGIVWIILYFIFHAGHYACRALYFIVAILLLSPMFWDIHTGNFVIDYCFTLIGGHPPDIYFPLIPWLVYPLTGLAVGYFIKKGPDRVTIVGWMGWGLIFISLFFPSTTYSNEWFSFYRTRTADTIFHIGFVLMWFALLNWISSKIRHNPFFQLLTFCSRNITVVCLIEGTLISWCLPLAGCQTNPLQSLICWMAAITLITILLTLLIRHPKQKERSRVQ